MIYRVFYPLISQTVSVDFNTRKEAEKCAAEKMQRTSHYLPPYHWRQVIIAEIDIARPAECFELCG